MTSFTLTAEREGYVLIHDLGPLTTNLVWNVAEKREIQL